MTDDPTTRPMSPPWAIIGCGRVGRTLIRLAAQLDIDVAVAWDRNSPPNVEAHQRLSDPLTSLEGRLDGCAVFITVSDDAISAVAAAVAGMCDDADVVVHCSGSLSSAVLREAGITAPVGSVHPLLSIADPEQALPRLREAFWTVEGDRPAVWWARGWLAKMDVTPLTISASAKVLYHAAAVTSAGLLVALMDSAFTLAEAAGIDGETAREMLLPLARSTLDNLAEMTSREALTGPVARDDDETIQAHRDAIAALDDETLSEIYEVLTARLKAL